VSRKGSSTEADGFPPSREWRWGGCDDWVRVWRLDAGMTDERGTNAGEQKTVEKRRRGNDEEAQEERAQEW